jgi:hypothetical protein
MQKINAMDMPYSAGTYNSQALTFIDNDFVGAENTQASEYNYELTFSNEPTNMTASDVHFHHPHSQQTQLQSQMDSIELSQVQK